MARRSRTDRVPGAAVPGVARRKRACATPRRNRAAAPEPLSHPARVRLLLAAIAIVFGESVHHDFVNYDDERYVIDNPQVARGITARGMVWAFTESHASNWHPLTWLSHMLDCQVYGLAQPGGHHLTSVLLHAVTAILLLLVLVQMTGDVWPGVSYQPCSPSIRCTWNPSRGSPSGRTC